MVYPHLPVGIPCYDLTPVMVSFLNPQKANLQKAPTPMVWRAVSARNRDTFTVACWSTITSNSGFMKSSSRLQSELGMALKICSISRYRFSLYHPLYCLWSPDHKGHDDLTSSSPSSWLPRQSPMTF